MTKLEETQLNCQIPCLRRVAEGLAEVPPESVGRRVKLIIRRRLSPGKERAFKNRTNDLINRFCQLTGRNTKPCAFPGTEKQVPLRAGDLVRVRSRQEIEATLNHWRQLKGCTFMPEMAEYCGTTQRVLKPMQRFVDERDLRVKKSNGIVLLEGV
ncbi:MAG: hypothetical protein ABIN58_01430, partial [candidate division WOR-3 bacterium]